MRVLITIAWIAIHIWVFVSGLNGGFGSPAVWVGAGLYAVVSFFEKRGSVILAITGLVVGILYFGLIEWIGSLISWFF